MDDSTQSQPGVDDAVRRQTVQLGRYLSRPTAYQVAQACATLGWRILPVAVSPSGEKKPALKNWPALATADLDVLDEWEAEGRFSRCVAAVATGAPSNLWVLDIDRHGADGFGALAALEAEHGPLPATFTVETPSKGRHLYWRWPEGGEKAVKNSQSGDGLDVRGWHGQVVAPGTWWQDRYWAPTTNTIEIPLPAAPDWLVEWAAARTVRHQDSWPERDHRSSAERDAEWVQGAADVGVGDRHDYLYRGLCSMRARDVDPDEMRRLALDAAARFPVGGRIITEEYVLYQVAWVIENYPPGTSQQDEPFPGANQLLVRR